ncbi:unnamed protein product [Chrysoparadoxa australica]
MKIWCLYGVGLAAERSYLYSKREVNEDQQDSYYSQTEKKAIKSNCYSSLHQLTLTPCSTPSFNPCKGYKLGIRMSDGDGTAPLLSLGYMCSAGWKDESLTFPTAGIQIPVKTVEYLHQPSNSALDRRGGGTSGNHVEVLGNNEFITHVLHIVSGSGEKVGERIVSKIEEMAALVFLLQ